MRTHSLVLLSALALTVPVAGFDAPEPEVSKTELQKLRGMIEEINAQAVNAGTKLRHGVVSMKSGPSDQLLTPARACCGNNIDKIGKQFELVGAAIRNLRSCYQAAGDADGEVKLNFFHEDASALYLAVGFFGGAKTDDNVQAGYGNMARTLLLLRKSLKNLTECDPSDES